MQYHSIPEHSSGTHPPNIHSQLSTSPTLSQSSLYTAYYTPHRSTHSRPNHTHHSPVYPVVSLGLSGPPSWNHIHRHDSIPIESLLSNTDCIYPTISIPIPPSVKTTLVGPAPIETVSLSTIATRTLSIVTIASRPTHREPIAIEPISSSHSLHSEPSPIHRLTLVSSTYTSPLSIPTPLSRIHPSHQAVVNYHRYQYLHAYPTRAVTPYNNPIGTNSIYYPSSPVSRRQTTHLYRSLSQRPASLYQRLYTHSHRKHYPTVISSRQHTHFSSLHAFTSTHHTRLPSLPLYAHHSLHTSHTIPVHIQSRQPPLSNQKPTLHYSLSFYVNTVSRTHTFLSLHTQHACLSYSTHTRTSLCSTHSPIQHLPLYPSSIQLTALHTHQVTLRLSTTTLHSFCTDL